MEPPRETISLLILSILGGLALTDSTIRIQETLSAKGLSIPLHSVLFFLVFFSIWLRFVPGNISHIRKLERWPKTTINTWLFDISVITIESMIIVFMATPSVTDPEVFLFALLGLLFLDMGWLAAMIRGVRKGTRPEPQWTWLGLNIPSAAVVVIFLLMNILRPDILELTSTLSSIIIAIVFGSCAVYDIHKSASDWFGRPRHPELSNEQRKTYEKYMREAIKEAKKGLSENGIPIGAILLENATIIGRGYNRRVQDGNPMAHAEIECLKNTGRRQNYRGTTLFSTLMPCCLCAGAIIQFGVKEVVVGEARNFAGARNLLEASGVNVTDLDMDECFEMLSHYIRSNPNIWDEDIGKS